MKRALLAVVLFLSLPAIGQEQRCFFVSTPPASCDGQGRGYVIPIPAYMPVPADITSAFFHHHIGTSWSEHIGGTVNVVINKPNGSFNLVSALNRHGAARWTWDPPVRFSAGDSISISYGCQTPAGVNGGMMPDVQICWRE